MHQWYKEIEKRVEKLQLRVHLYHGPSRESKPCRYERKQYTFFTFISILRESYYKATNISSFVYIEKKNDWFPYILLAKF